MYPIALASTLPGPEWLRAVRTSAAERAAVMPLPSFETEEWRYSPIGEFDPAHYRPSFIADAEGSDAFDVGTVAARVSTVNGVVTDLVVTAPRLEVHRAGDLDQPVDFGEPTDIFGTANLAFCPDPIVIRVPAGVEIEHPIVIDHRLVGDGVAAFSRVRVEVGADAGVRIIETLGSHDAASLIVPVTEIVAGPSSRVRYQQLQELGQGVWQLGSLSVDVESQATFSGGVAAMGASYGRLRTDCRLVGRGASGDLLAVYYGDGHQTLDFRTFQVHLARDTTSNLLFKGVLDGHARSIYTGLIKVAAEAAGTNAFQTNRNIKLSDHAWAESVPNLEIETNDVRCSHASTVSPIDEEQRFYLESRGVPSTIAERLVVEGFLAEVLDHLPVPEAARHLELMIHNALASRGGALAVAS